MKSLFSKLVLGLVILNSTCSITASEQSEANIARLRGLALLEIATYAGDAETANRLFDAVNDPHRQLSEAVFPDVSGNDEDSHGDVYHYIEVILERSDARQRLDELHDAILDAREAAEKKEKSEKEEKEKKEQEEGHEEESSSSNKQA